MNDPRWLRWVLWLYPKEFRHLHSREISDFVRAELKGGRSRRSLAVLRIGMDLTRSGLSLRLRPAGRGILATMRKNEGEGWMMTILGDFQLAVRGLIRTKGFAAVVILTLALGIGLTTSLFSVVNAVLLRPLEYDNPDELLYLSASLPAKGIEDGLLTGGDLRDLRELPVFSVVEGLATIRQNLNGAGLPRQVDVGWASGGFLAMLGVEPVLGRVHAPEDAPGGVVLGFKLWQNALGEDPDVVGRTVQLDGYPYTVIGVMPEQFRLRLPSGRPLPEPEVWKNPDGFWQNGNIWEAQGPGLGMLKVVARLAPGPSLADAQAGLAALTADLRSRYPDFEADQLSISAAPLQKRLVENVGPTLKLPSGAVALVLLIACANVANLLLVRGQSRRREMAVRLALGSPRGRVGRFFMLEGFALALAGSLCGLGIAWGAVTLAPSLAPRGLPLADTISVDGVVFLFALLAAFCSTLLVGALPAWSALHTDPAAELGNGRSLGAGGGKARDILVIGQVGLSIILLVGTGLLTSSLMRLSSVDPGFNPNSLYAFGVSVPGSQYGWPKEAGQFYREVEARVAALPGVESAGVIWPMPFSDSWSGEHATSEGEVVQRGLVDYRLATEAYFETARIPLLDGEVFREGNARFSVVVSQVVAERTWPGQSPIGRTLQADPWGGGLRDFEVIGVVGDIRDQDLRVPADGTLYFDTRGWSWVDWEVHILARTSMSEAALLPALRATLADIDVQVPLAHPAPLEEAMQKVAAPARFVLALLGAFAAAAGLLALVGLYGVVSYTVGMRSKEFGLRMALGSPQRSIRGLVVRRGVVLAGAGVVVGLAGAWLLADVLDSLLYEVSGTDPLTYLAVATLLATGAVAASWIPAWRASRVDPVRALNGD